MTNEKLRGLVAELDLQTDLWWLAMMLLGFMTSLLAAFTDGGIFWAYLSVFVRLSMALGLSQQPWGGVFSKLLGLAVATGIFGVFGDYLLVSWQGGQRKYDLGAAVILSSPLYVPLAWAALLVEFGYILVRLFGLTARKLPEEAAMGVTMVAGGLLAAVWTVCTEFWAVKAEWWRYESGTAILGGACALYVVIGMFFIFVAFLPIFGRYLACGGTRVYASLRYGIVMGGIIFLSFLAAHFLVERH